MHKVTLKAIPKKIKDLQDQAVGLCSRAYQSQGWNIPLFYKHMDILFVQEQNCKLCVLHMSLELEQVDKYMYVFPSLYVISRDWILPKY